MNKLYMLSFSRILLFSFMLSFFSQELQAGPKIIVLNHNEENSETKISLGSDVIQIEGRSHNSVGINFIVECDTTAFAVKSSSAYSNPESMEKGERGGDNSTVIYTLTPKKKGTFTVYTVVNYRGNEESRKKHIIKIK